MHGRRVLNRLGWRFLLAAGTAALAVSIPTAQPSNSPRQPAGVNAVPTTLGPTEYFAGVPWTGRAPVTITVGDLMTREALATPVGDPPRERRHEQAEREFDKQRELPGAAAVSQWPTDGIDGIDGIGGDDRTRSVRPHVAFSVSTNFQGPKLSESGFIPPDSIGAVGPTQVLVAANGRFKVYDKAAVPGAFNVTDQTFWSAVITPGGGTFVSDPHVRYDRLSGRWFITEIDVPEPCECSNRILVAVSSGSTITSSSSFTLFSFQHDVVGPTPNPDTGGFADYDTLGIDASALYIGVNEFAGAAGGGGFINTTGYVVNKASLIAGGPPVVTAFRQLLDPVTFVGVYTPQGVDNDDPAAAEGYFVGVDGGFFSRLAVRRVIDPGGSPSISGTMLVTVPTTRNPIPQVANGSVRPLDAIDTRLFAAMIKKNKLTGVGSLWTAHNIAVNLNGVAVSDGGTSGLTIDRNAGRWYQLDNLATTPTLTQAGTVFDPAPSNPIGYWMNSIAANGQGHAAIGQSFASTAIFAGWAVFSRASGDSAGQMSNGFGNPGGGAYNVQTGGTAPQRWGDYSQTVVDPTDDMTLWTFQEYADATDSWSVRAVRLQAPPPATFAGAAPSSVNKRGSVMVTVTGTSMSSSGFFDPGPGFDSRIHASVSGGVLVTSVTFVNPTTVVLDLNTFGASSGVKNVTIINPDGQSTSGTGALTVMGGAAVLGATGDFDGDAKSDVTVFRPSTGGWHVLKSSAGYGASTSFSWGLSTDMPVPADYDGDGKIDPAIFRPSTGLWAYLKSSTAYTTSASVPWGLSTDVPVPADYDGDGKVDPTVYRPSTGGWFVLKSSTAYSSSMSFSWGLSTDLPVQGDYDGDGKAEPAIFRPSTGLWAYLKSSTGYTTSVVVSWGLSSDVAVPGDYDGDGKIDPAIFRPSTGLWAYLKSSTSYTTSAVVSWGLSTDVPVPADYDGDGKFDPAIFRSSTGLWAYLRSSTNYASSSTVSWGLGTDVPINKRP